MQPLLSYLLSPSLFIFLLCLSSWPGPTSPAGTGALDQSLGLTRLLGSPPRVLISFIIRSKKLSFWAPENVFVCNTNTFALFHAAEIVRFNIFYGEKQKSPGPTKFILGSCFLLSPLLPLLHFPSTQLPLLFLCVLPLPPLTVGS